jgi:hypothetical protein
MPYGIGTGCKSAPAGTFVGKLSAEAKEPKHLSASLHPSRKRQNICRQAYIRVEGGKTFVGKLTSGSKEAKRLSGSLHLGRRRQNVCQEAFCREKEAKRLSGSFLPGKKRQNFCREAKNRAESVLTKVLPPKTEQKASRQTFCLQKPSRRLPDKHFTSKNRAEGFPTNVFCLKAEVENLPTKVFHLKTESKVCRQMFSTSRPGRKLADKCFFPNYS